MFGDLNDCYGAALQRELAEANRLEQEMIEAGNREAEAYYAEIGGVEEQAIMEKVDCHYCNYGCCESPESECDCYNDDGYFDHHVNDSKEEAEKCKWFMFCDSFPKY